MCVCVWGGAVKTTQWTSDQYAQPTLFRCRHLARHPRHRSVVRGTVPLSQMSLLDRLEANHRDGRCERVCGARGRATWQAWWEPRSSPLTSSETGMQKAPRSEQAFQSRQVDSGANEVGAAHFSS